MTNYVFFAIDDTKGFFRNNKEGKYGKSAFSLRRYEQL